MAWGGPGYKIWYSMSILVILFSAVHAFVSIRSQREQLVSEALEIMDSLGEVARLSIREEMLRYSPNRLQQALSGIGAGKTVERIRIFNHTGTIVYSSQQSELKTQIDQQASQCVVCHGSKERPHQLSLSARKRLYASPDGHGMLGVIIPVYNEPSCFNASCHAHSPERTILGIIDIDGSLERTDALIRSSAVRILSMGVAMTAFMILAIKLVTDRFVAHPLQDLAAVARRAAGDDAKHGTAAKTGDEFVFVAQALNKMSEDVERARSSLDQWGCRLEQMVCERTRDIQETHQQLIRSEKLASLGKLAAGVAHEINNPLTGILTFGQLLLDELPPGSSQHQDLEIIVRETIRCRNIVRGLLEFSRQAAPEKSPVQIHRLMDEVLQILRTHESFQNIRIETSYAPETPLIMADSDQLKQVFFNVVINASEAMTGGGAMKIVTRWISDQSLVTVRIIDDGPGIHPEHRNKVFDPFFTTKEMGTGLGLAISYGVIKTHQGDIEIISEEGKGCEVVITLPAPSSEASKSFDR